MVKTTPSNSPGVPLGDRVQKVQQELDGLMSKELDGASVLSKSTSYSAFRVFYLRAVSQLRPKFFEDDEDFLDKDLRVAEWEKRRRYNQLKQAWIRYDKIAPDKARDLPVEDQEIENDLDLIEEEIQEEWKEFADELLDILDMDDEEDFGDDEDMDDLEQWKGEMKQMQKDESLLKRRILERTMQRRAREEEEQKKLAKEERERRQEDLSRRSSINEEVADISKKSRKKAKKKDEDKELRKSKHSNREHDEKSSTRKVKGVHSEDGALVSPTESKHAAQILSSPRKSSKKKSSSKSKSSEENLAHHHSWHHKHHHKDKPSKSEAPDTPKVKRRTASRRNSVEYMKRLPDLEEETESVTSSKSSRSSRRASMSSMEQSTSLHSTTSAVSGVAAMRQRFSQPTTPKPPSQMFVSKYKFGITGIGAPPLASPLSGKGSAPGHDDKTTKNGVNKQLPSIRGIIKTLEIHEMVSTEELVRALCDLSEACRDSSESMKEFGRGKGNGLLYNIVQRYQAEASVIDASFRAIINLIEYETNRDALALLGVIESTLMAMLVLKESTGVQEHGCDLLGAFAVSRKYQDWIVASNGIQVILTTQAAFVHDALVQTACFRALTKIATNHRENSRHVAAEGGVKALMAVIGMPEHEKDVNFHRVALKAVSVLVKSDDANRGSVAKSDGIFLTLLAMESFADDGELQQYACEALCGLANEHSQNCDSIVKQGGLRILSKTMKEHRQHLGVQEGALPLLTQLTEKSVNSRTFADEGGVDRVLVAMRNFESSSIVHEYGCLTLCNMAIEEENKETIRNLGGIRMIVSAMRLLGSNTFVQKSGCRALDALATNDQSKVTIAASGGVSAMLSAMQTHLSVAGVQGLAIAALRKLATITRNRNIMKMNRGIETVEEAMRKYPKHGHLQKNGRALVKLLDPARALLSTENNESANCASDTKSTDAVSAPDVLATTGSIANETEITDAETLEGSELYGMSKVPEEPPGFRASKIIVT